MAKKDTAYYEKARSEYESKVASDKKEASARKATAAAKDKAATASNLKAGASVALGVFAAGEAAKASQRNDMRQAEISQQSRKMAFNRESQAYLHNMNRLKEQNTSDNFNISVAEATARDQLAQATAGSGLAGASIDEMDSEITRGVAQDRVARERDMKSSRDAMNQERIQANENRVIEAENMGVQDYNGELTGALFSSVGSALLM